MEGPHPSPLPPGEGTRPHPSPLPPGEGTRAGIGYPCP